MAPYKILKQGYMMKEPPASKRGLRRKLHRYWFVLVEDPQQVALVYFKNEDAYISRQRNEGFIRVDNSISINVISEHLGHKNAFVIKSVRTDYTMVPESRYDLHEWISTLHNAIEAFKLKQRKAEERRRMPLRLRANTAESINPPTNTPASPGGSLRMTTPTRRAPPAPPVAAAAATGQASLTGSITRRKPVRPAPVAPGPRRNRSQSHSLPMSPGGPLPRDTAGETPPPAYSDTSSVTTPVLELNQARGVARGSPGISESSEHPIMDLNISHTDRDETNREVEQRTPSSERDRPHLLNRQTASDTLLLMHQNSASLPDLMNCEVQGSLTNGGVATKGVVLREVGGVIRQRSMSESRHTRSLSLTGTEDIHAKRLPRDRKKRSARRNGSIKLRSRSPPNLPPPPPPPTTMGKLQEETTANEDADLDDVDRGQSAGLTLGLSPLHTYGGGDALQSQSSSVSVGFSEVLNTISHIDHELDEIVVSPVKPSVPAPKRMTVTMATAATQPEPAEFTVGQADDDFNEEEWLCDVPDETMPISPPKRPTPEGGPQSDTEPEPVQKPGGFIPADQLISGGFIPAAVVEGGKSTSDPRPKVKAKNRVMFKEEVEDIPNYEPRVDHEVGNNQEDDEEVPTGVAALKKKLFGDKEKQTARYKKEGIMSPRHTHPDNMTFEAGYKFDDSSAPFFRESSPNVNNNNGSEREQAKPRLSDQKEGGVSVVEAVPVTLSDVPAPKKSKRVQEGLYDPPWEQSAVSKYKVIGRMRAESFGKQSGKERTTPPPVSPKTKKGGMQFGEVSTTETPKPGSMEIRNVHSLERSKKNRIRQQKQQQDPSHSLTRPAPAKQPSPSSPSRSFSLDHTPNVSASAADESLLDSITDTLQKHSKYGSIDILSPPSSRMAETEPSKPKKVPSEVRRSSRGELEKIRAAHRREPPPPPMGVATSPPVTTPTHASPKHSTNSSHSSPRRTNMSPHGSSAHSSPQRSSSATQIYPPGMFIGSASRTSPQGPNMMPGAKRSSPQNQHVAQPTTNSAHLSWHSPSHSSPKQSVHYSSQILTSPAHRSGQAKRRMFSGRPRMAASLDELQTDPSTQVTYDATAKTHIFRSLV